MTKPTFRFIVPVVVGLMVSMIFTTVINEPVSNIGLSHEGSDFDESLEDPHGEDALSIESSESVKDEISTPAHGAGESKSSRGGNLEWIYSANEGAVSTPALVDLDTDGFLEVIFVTTGDEIIALNNDGEERWKNSNYVIEAASYFSRELNLDFWPADLFSSVTPANIDRDIRPELILGAYNGLVFLNHDGEPKYSQAHNGRYYFSTPVVCDLEGDYSKIDLKGDPVSYYKDFEILTGSDNEQRNAYLEAWHATGGDIFDEQVVQGGESAFVLGIAVGDLDGSMEDEVYEENEEADMEIVFATHDRGMRIFHQNGEDYSPAHDHYHPVYEEDTAIGQIPGHLSYATAAIGNFSKKINPDNPEQLEIIVGKGGWHGRSKPYQVISNDAGLYCYDKDGTEHWRAMAEIVVASSPAVGDVQTEDRDESTRADAEYEIFACNSHEGEIYSIDADDGTEIWHWEIEGTKSSDNRILSSPAICNINSDSELEVVVGSDNGKVYCFDGDPSDAVNDGEEYALSGEGSSFDLLWMFDTHEYSDKVASVGKIGISSPVIADIDKDGVLEVVIGDTVGNVWCIDAGGTSSRGQRDWTMFHYDTNNSGFYDPRMSYAVDIKMARDPYGPLVVRERYVEPGATTTFDLVVINKGQGLSQDDFDNIYISSYISSDLGNTGWGYTLEGDAVKEHDGMKYVKLLMQDFTTLQLNVTAPWHGGMGDYIAVVIKVNSSMDHNAVDSITVYTYLLIKVDFELEFAWPPESDPQSPYYQMKCDYDIQPGEERTYSISVVNTGNVNDTYRISVVDYDRIIDVRFVDSPDPLNYTVSLDSHIFEGAKNSTMIQLRVRIPEEGLEGSSTFHISIEGVSHFSEREQEKPHPLIGLITRTDAMIIKVGDRAKLLLETNEGEKYILPGERVRYKVRVINNGNFDFTVALSHSEPTRGWTVQMPDSVDVSYGGGVEYIEVFLTAPGEEYQVRAETREMITIFGEVETSQGMLSSSVGIAGVMTGVSHLNVTVWPGVNTTLPGGRVGYFVTIENLGNGGDELELLPLRLSLGWDMRFPGGSKLYIDWKETVMIEFEVWVPVNALAGTYTSVLNVSGSNPEEENFVTVKTLVLQIHDISIDVYNEDFDWYMPYSTQYVTPGGSTIYEIRVTNDGNGEDAAELRVFLYKYNTPTGEHTLTGMESDAMMEDAEKTGDVRWFFRSVASSPGVLSTEPVYADFNDPIKIGNTDGNLYQPKDSKNYATALSLVLLPGQTAWVQFEVEYPLDEDKNPIYFTVLAESGGIDGKPGNNRANMSLEIKYSDLTFDKSISKMGMEIIGEQTEKTPQLNIRVRIRNVGEIDARDIRIVLYVDGQYRDSRSVMRLVNSAGNEYIDILISFTWKPIEGRHVISVKIDPDNSIIESNENNNEVRQVIKIQGENTLPEIMSGIGACPIIIVIITAVIIGAAGYYTIRRRRY